MQVARDEDAGALAEREGAVGPEALVGREERVRHEPGRDDGGRERANRRVPRLPVEVVAPAGAAPARRRDVAELPDEPCRLGRVALPLGRHRRGEQRPGLEAEAERDRVPALPDAEQRPDVDGESPQHLLGAAAHDPGARPDHPEDGRGQRVVRVVAAVVLGEDEPLGALDRGT